jgi:hypoxanthine-guanine phosphoribosyltransferase
MEIGLIILVGLLIGALTFCTYLIYSLNEKIMIMSRSSSVYEYKEVQEKSNEQDEEDNELQSLGEIGTEEFIQAIIKPK